MQVRAAALQGSSDRGNHCKQELCIHTERELMKVLQLHVSLPDLPTRPNTPRSLHRSQLQDFL